MTLNLNYHSNQPYVDHPALNYANSLDTPATPTTLATLTTLANHPALNYANSLDTPTTLATLTTLACVEHPQTFPFYRLQSLANSRGNTSVHIAAQPQLILS